MGTTTLKGITWGHSRGITPLLAVSQRYSELNPGIEITWSKRTLQEFADFPIEKLAESYDLLIIDHPWVGCAAATKTVLPLNEYLPGDYLEEQANHSVGESYKSYVYDGSLWALPIDAATPAASFRKDLFEQNHATVPQAWEELIALAKVGRVAVPAIPIDLLMNFYSFCIACGHEPFQQEDEVIDSKTGTRALEKMKELYSLVDKKMFGCNPIDVAEQMSSTDDYWYCPFAYGYSNYARKGFAKYLLHYGDVVSLNGEKLRTTIGGTGIAVSSFSKNKSVAVDFAKLICSPECQQTMYVEYGGQPGHRSAWENGAANKLTNGFFGALLPVMDNGYVRPRYNGYLHFQDHAGYPLQQYLKGENITTAGVLNEMNKIYWQSLLHKKTIAALC